MSTNVAHFAVHGGPKGLVLKWSVPIQHRVAIDYLSGSEIRSMREFMGKLVVSGACGSASLADDFLVARAKAFVAPLFEIQWKNLGLFLSHFTQH